MSAHGPCPFVAALDLVNRRGAAVAVRRYTGKSPHGVHPKHRSDAPWHHWYVEHLKPGDLVLDLGCANGAHALVAARSVRRVVGAELHAGGFAPEGAVLPVVYDTAWAGIIDVVGRLSLTAYRRLSVWKRQAALRRPEESIGFRVVARRTTG